MNPINPKLLDKFIRVCERAAFGASKFRGKNDKVAADQAAVDEMRAELNKIEMKGSIVIGEGEMDEAPMLFIGERVGTNSGEELDIAVDPLEGTNFTAKNLPNAISVKRLIQNPFRGKKFASIIIVSHKAKNCNLVKCINELGKKNFILSKPKFIRIEKI